MTLWEKKPSGQKLNVVSGKIFDIFDIFPTPFLLRYLVQSHDDGFFLPDSRALLPTFRTNCPDGVSFCPDGVSFCPDFHPQPLFFTPPSHTPFWDMYVHITPPHPTPKHPFSKSAPRPAPPLARPAPARARSRPLASCSALENALRVVRFRLQCSPVRAAAQTLRFASCSVNATT